VTTFRVTCLTLARMSLGGLVRTVPARVANVFADRDRELVIERACALARIAGGFLALAIGPFFGIPFAVVVALVVFVITGPAFLHLWLWQRTKSRRGRERLRWLCVANDCIAAIAALAVLSRDATWSVILVVPLVIFVETVRAGVPGGLVTTIVMSLGHLVLADFRRIAFGYTPEPAALAFQLGLYWLSLFLAIGVFRELHTLQSLRAELFGPLLAAQDRFGDGVLIRQGDRFVFVGDAMGRITGHAPQDLEMLSSMLALVVPAERETVAQRLRLPGPDRFETRFLHRDGHEVPVEVVRAEVGPTADRRVVAVVRDISERRAIAESLEFTALHDMLTGLPNRLNISRAVDNAIGTRKEPVSVIAMHLDHFEDVKETFGHVASDELLRHVATRVRTRLRSMDVMGHGGGDEFMIVLIGADATVAERTARSVRELFAEPFDVVGRPLLSSVNIGIASYPDHGDDATTLLRCAEIAAGRAARLARGSVVYDPNHDAGRIDRMELLADLRDLLANGELGLAFQPCIDIKTGLARGFEALARWDHPSRGPVPPTAFIPLAEYSGLIKPLTEQMLAKALEHCREWNEQGAGVDVAVNVSIRNLADADFPDLVARLLTVHSFEPERLVLEVTESLVMADLDEYVRTLTHIRRLGVRVALDDFGSGYSSLTQLHRLPVTQAKIDRGFIERLGSPDGDSVVRGAVDIAHALRLETVAEGVASMEVLERLGTLGCDLAQGFAIGMPMHPSAVLPWIRGRQRGPLRLVGGRSA
jgi:diguanylate cyclase (GGDEF)-like protein/PAS domain S-box-containing protein